MFLINPHLSRKVITKEPYFLAPSQLVSVVLTTEHDPSRVNGMVAAKSSSLVSAL